LFKPGTVVTVLGLAVVAVGLAFAAVGFVHATPLLLGLLFVIPALLNLPVAVILWAPFAFLPPLGFVGAAPTAGAAVILLAWLPSLRGRGAPTRALLALHARPIVVGFSLLIWLTLSLSWAGNPDSGLEALWQWWLAGVGFLIAITTIATRRQARLFVTALVVGAVLSAVVGFLGESLSTSASALELAAEDRRRLGAILDDPNYVGAGLVAAIMLATGLLQARSPLASALLVGAMGVMTLAVAATESRGALVACGVAVLGALLFYSGRRAQVVTFLAALAALGAMWFSVNPHAWERVSEFDSSGTGRSALWEVAWRITQDHPVVGVGLDNFVEEAPKYTTQPGKLEAVRDIAERPHVAHNVYLQFLAETGFIGLGLFLGLLFSCARAAWLAGRLFDLKQDREMAALARGCLVAIIAFASASVFISNGDDVRYWLLLALGPIVYGVASRTIAEGRPPIHRRGPNRRSTNRIPSYRETKPTIVR
jgi:O-antigen ligase